MIVADSSAVVGCPVPGAAGSQLRAYLADADIHASTLLDFEVATASRGLTLGGHLSTDRAADALIDFEDLTIQRWPSAGALRQRALDLRHNLSAYDAAYVVLAEALGCALVTRDARLLRAAGHDAVIEVR